MQSSAAMAAEPSHQSDLGDVSYQHLYKLLYQRHDSNDIDQIADIIQYRLRGLRHISKPFGSPSETSRKHVQSGIVTLHGQTSLKLSAWDREASLAVSKEFDIDEVEAAILVRSFLYHESVLAGKDNSRRGTAEEVPDAIASFYNSERIDAFRVFLPLFRAYASGGAPLTDIAIEALPEMIPDGSKFAEDVIAEYIRKSEARVPERFALDVKKAALWAKQNLKEQLALLEVLYWCMWDYTPCTGPLVVQIYETAYGTNLGSVQANSTLLLDDECSQLLQDIAALWILATLEVLELERVGDPRELRISGDQPRDIYWLYPDALLRLHEIVTSHSDSQFSCSYAAWSYFLSRFVALRDSMKEMPQEYLPFYETISPPIDRSYSKLRDPPHVLMANAVMQPEAGLLRLLLTLLTGSSLLVTSVAWKTGSSVTDPNAIAYRSVLKGFVIALVELAPVELNPEFEVLVEVWIALFGRSECMSIAAITTQFWQADYNIGFARKAIFDAARARFPVQSKPLIRLLRSMTAAGFLDTDPLHSGDRVVLGPAELEQKDICGQYVLNYLSQLSSFTQIIPVSACSGPNALYEKLPERMISSSVSTGLTYTNLRPLKLPGGSKLPPKSIGRLLSGDSGDVVVVAWQHEHSGWKVLMEILTDYVNRRRMISGGADYDVAFHRRTGLQVQVLRLDDIGTEMDAAGDDILVTDILDLLRSLVQDCPELGSQLLHVLESGQPVNAHTMLETDAPDLVQLTTLILEDALSRHNSQQRSPPSTQLITSSLSLLSALLTLPRYSNRVWLYIRSTASLFGSERTVGCTPAVLATERLIGQYTMTMALLRLVQQLFDEASSTVLSVLQDTPHLQKVKEEVLIRAIHFVHSEIWIEHAGWKYSQLGDRFEIGRRVATLYTNILRQSPPPFKDAPFSTLSQAIAEVLILRTTTSAISPLIQPLTAAAPVLATLDSARRWGDARRLIYMLESHLTLIRELLILKQKTYPSTKLCVLEQLFCTRISSGLSQSTAAKSDPIDALASLVQEHKMGRQLPTMAAEVLSALCASLSSAQDSSPTIIGHLSNPEATVTSMVRIVVHAFEERSLRKAVWDFIILAVDKEPALAGLFVNGQFRTPSVKGKEIALTGSDTSQNSSALSISAKMLDNWRSLWELNPQGLSSILHFLYRVWEHGYSHKEALARVRQDSAFFDNLVAIVKEELGPVPDYKAEGFDDVNGVQRSAQHSAVFSHANRMMAKAHAVGIIGLDLRMSLPQEPSQASAKPPAYQAIQSILHNEEQITDLIAEAWVSSFDPMLYDEFHDRVQTTTPTLILDHLQVQTPLIEREFGDNFIFSTSLLEHKLQPYAALLVEETAAIKTSLMSINLNVSLTEAQTTLTEMWQFLLLQTVPFARGDSTVRPTVLSLAAHLSTDIGGEKRGGDMMAGVHNARLTLLLSLLELAWFSTSDKPVEVQHFIALAKGLRDIVLNEAQAPSKSFLGQSHIPYHRPLLQAAYFCARHSRSLLRRPKVLNADQRLSITSMLEAILELVIDALRITFDTAQGRLDAEVDQDMELLVAVFEQCTRPDLNPSSALWLGKCQQSDVIRASLQLFSQMDIVGYSDIAFLRSRKQPLYTLHVLSFHRALASIPSAAERLASEGIITAYSENSLTTAARNGSVDTVLPDLPGERSPAHVAYCSMLSVVSGIATALGHHGQYFITDACALVQLYGDQIHRALSWTMSDSLTLPLLEEMEQTVNLFYAISCSPREDETVKRSMQFFTADALLLLQQLNYALTHQNHLSSLFESITTDERAQYEADGSQAAAVSASSDVLDLSKRPFLAGLVHRLFGLSNSILLTLLNISRAETVLLGEPEDWPSARAMIVPHSKVVLGEPTSLGTLLELGNHALDVLRHLSDRPTSQTVAVAYAKSTQRPLDVRESVVVTRRSLEAAVFYAVTQLAVWLSKPEFDGPSHDMEAEESVSELQMSEKERRASRRRSMTMAERLRRGMTGEMAMDLQSLLTKAKPVVAKSNTLLEKNGLDVTSILSNFLSERLLISS